MPSPFKNVNDYILSIPEDRAEAFQNLRKAISSNLPKGFEECISYGMIGYVVPHSLYPKGYHCNPKLPLPFVSIASQKNFIALYHMGMYADKKILDWFVAEYPKYSKKKLDMGKSCVRFKYIDDIPFDLIGTLMQKLSVKDWIKCYETAFRK
jgi:hypothetical protein